MPKLEFAQVEVCEACQNGKMKRSSHKSKAVNSVDKVDAQQMINEENIHRENHGSGSSSHTPEFDSTNSGGEREEGSSSHTDNEENDESTSQKTHTRKWDRSHIREAIIGDPTAGVRTRSATANDCLHACFLSQVEPKKIDKALLDPDWISAM
ncbi:hypothetical protein AgCh_035062 [Apium graveolens]